MDHFFLHSAGGSVYNLGSFLDVSEALDLGFDALDRPVYAESPLVDGAAFGFESSGARTWAFPLVLPSGADGKSLDAFQAALRLGARPGGGKLIAHPFGVASSEAVHFDVLSGRWRPAYHARERGVGRTRGTLELDTQPFGYWPTTILLASAASVGAPGMLAVPGASVIGDVPGLAEVFIAPTTATSYGKMQMIDSVYWSLAARPSVLTWWRAASALPSGVFISVAGDHRIPPTVIGDQFAPGSQAMRVIAWTPSYTASDSNSGIGNNVAGVWQRYTAWVIPSALCDAHSGRYRAYAWMRFDVPTDTPYFPYQVSLDVTAGTSMVDALASVMPVATLPPAIASSDSSDLMGGASPAYSFLDLGELSLPPVASRSGQMSIRLWGKAATTNFGYATTATAALFIGGLYLQPIDGPGGVLPRGIAHPTWSGGGVVQGARLRLSSIEHGAWLEGPTAAADTPVPLRDAFAHYRGGLPLVGPSTVRFDLNFAGKPVSTPPLISEVPTSHPPVRSEAFYASVSVRYRPRFTFTKTL